MLVSNRFGHFYFNGFVGKVRENLFLSGVYKKYFAVLAVLGLLYLTWKKITQPLRYAFDWKASDDALEESTFLYRQWIEKPAKLFIQAVIDRNWTQARQLLDELEVHQRALFFSELRACQIEENRQSLSSLHLAACLGKVDVARVLVNFISPSLQDKKGWTPLHYAAAMGKKEMVRFLAGFGIGKILDKKGDSPLHVAVANYEFAVTEILAKHDLTKIRNGFLQTALDIAVEKRLVHMVQLLVEIDPSSRALKAPDRPTPLELAVSKGDVKIVKILLVNSLEDEKIKALADAVNRYILHGRVEVLETHIFDETPLDAPGQVIHAILDSGVPLKALRDVCNNHPNENSFHQTNAVLHRIWKSFCKLEFACACLARQTSSATE